MKIRDRDAVHTEILYTTYANNPNVRWLRRVHKVAVCRTLREDTEPLRGRPAYVGSAPLLYASRPPDRYSWLNVFTWVQYETAR